MAAGTPASPSIHLQPWPAETHQQAEPMRGRDVTVLTHQRLMSLLASWTLAKAPQVRVATNWPATTRVL